MAAVDDAGRTVRPTWWQRPRRRPGSARFHFAMAGISLVLALSWAILWWAEADRGLLTPWFPGYLSVPGWAVLAGVFFGKGLRRRRAEAADQR